MKISFLRIHAESYQPFFFPHWSLHMRAITTNEITDTAYLINKARELKTAHSLSIRSLMHLQAQADTLYSNLLENVDFGTQTKMLSFFNDFEDACSTFDDLIAEHQLNEYMSKVAALCDNDEYEALPDFIKRIK